MFESDITEFPLEEGVDNAWLQTQRVSSAEVFKNWNPFYKYTSDKRTVYWHWCNIAHPRRIAHLSHFAERVYLADIARRRKAFADIQLHTKGWPLKRSHDYFDRQLCKADLYYLAKFILGYDRLQFHYHKPMADSMQGLGKEYRGLRQFPRDTYKSTVCTISYAVQCILRDPEERILIQCNSLPNAYKKMGEAKNHFLKANGELVRLFPEHYSAKLKDQGEKGRWDSPAKKSAQEEGTLNAMGVGGRSTSNHYTLIIADDFWDEKSVQSEMMTTKTNEALSKLRYLLDEPEQRNIIFVGTRFSQTDPTTALQTWPNFHAIIVPAILPCGRSVVPEKFSLLGLYNDWQGNPRTFSCNMMQNPKEGAMSFHREWFKYRFYSQLVDDRKKDKIAYYLRILVDFPGTGNGDKGALHVVAFDSNKQFTIVDCTYFKGDIGEFIGHIYDKVDQYPEVKAIVGQKATTEQFSAHVWQNVERQRRESGKITPPWELASLKGQKKERRILTALQPRYAMGLIYHDPDRPAIRELENQLINYMTGVPDDMPDALVAIGDENVAIFPALRPALPPPAKEFQMTRTAATNLEVDYRRQRAIDIDKQFQAQFSEDRADREDDYDA